jgi:hypothetical protein
MALKHVLLGIGVVAAVGAGYLAYRYASAPANTTSTPMVEVKRAAQESGNAIQSIAPNNHFEAGKPQATAY